MLSAPDRTVVERDPAVPGLAVLLDSEAVVDLLARLYPEGDARAAEAFYLRYKPGTSCLVGYRVRLGAGETLAYARASRPDQPDKVHKGTQRRTVPAALGGGVRVAAREALTVYPFPHDHELRALARLADEQRRRRLLRALLPDHAHLWGGSVVPLRYKPERRFVGRLHGNDGGGEPGTALLKFFSAPEFVGWSAALDRLRSDPPLRLPRILGRSLRHRAYATEWLEGRPLTEALTTGSFLAPAFHMAGAALARLHRQDASLERVLDGPAVASTLVGTAEALTCLQPELAGRAERLVARLDRLLNDRVPQRQATIHGDFSSDQVLAREGEVAVVDLDGAARGEPLIDLAWFEASLLADAAVHGFDRDLARRAFRALLEGYETVSALENPHLLAAFTGAALLRRAVEPFRLRVERWPEANEALLAEAEAMAGAGAAVEAWS